MTRGFKQVELPLHLSSELTAIALGALPLAEEDDLPTLVRDRIASDRISPHLTDLITS